MLLPWILSLHLIAISQRLGTMKSSNLLFQLHQFNPMKTDFAHTFKMVIDSLLDIQIANKQEL